MGFYTTSTPEQKRVKKLTGDINISEAFKNECLARDIPIYNAYNIQKKLIFEVESEQLVGVDKVDERLMELLDERGKKEVPHRYVDLIGADDNKPNLIPPKQHQNVPSKRKPPKPLPRKSISEIQIPPRGRDGKTFSLKFEEKEDNEVSEVELLQKLVTQNQKIINQNNIIINLLKKIGEKDD